MRALGLFAAFIGLVGIAGGCKPKVELTEFRFNCSNLISRGDGYVNEGELAKAKVTYLLAKALLESKEGRVLPKKEREDWVSQLAAKLKSVEASMRYEDAIAAAEEARKDGDKIVVIPPSRPRGIRHSAEVEARIKSLRSQVDMARAHDLIEEGNRSEAIKVLKKLLGYDPGNSDAKALLRGLERRAKWLKVLSEAHRLYRKQDYAGALAKYNEAAALLPPDATVKERMVDCRYRIKITEAERLRQDGKLVEAIKAYEEALKIRPDKAAWISALQEMCKREMQYRKHLEAGETAQKNKDWKSALAEYRKAQRIKDSAEIQARIKTAKYSRFKALGTAALDNGDPKSAKAYFNRAKDIMDTEEIKKLIAHADSLIDASRTSE